MEREGQERDGEGRAGERRRGKGRREILDNAAQCNGIQTHRYIFAVAVIIAHPN